VRGLTPGGKQVQRTEAVNTQLAGVLGEHFPTPSPLPVPDDAPAEALHLLLQGREAQLAFSKLQADFEVRFFGPLEASVEDCREYVVRKMLAVFHAWSAVGARPVWLGLVLTLHRSMPDEEAPGRLLFEKHLQPELDDPSVHEVVLHLGVRVADHFNATLGIGQYESRQVTRAATAMTAVVRAMGGRDH